MTKTELVSAIAEKGQITKTDADKALKAFVEVVTETLTAGDKIQLVGFGTFETRDRAAREGINPLTKEKIKIAASKAPAFKPSSALKEAVNVKKAAKKAPAKKSKKK